MKSHPALNIELKKKKLVKLKWKSTKEEKTRQIEKGSRKEMSETTNWLRLRSHSYLVQKLPKNGPKTPFSPILSAICAVLFIHYENSYRYRLNKLEIFRIFLLYAVAHLTIKIWPFFKTNFYFFFASSGKLLMRMSFLLQKQKL